MLSWNLRIIALKSDDFLMHKSDYLVFSVDILDTDKCETFHRMYRDIISTTERIHSTEREKNMRIRKKQRNALFVLTFSILMISTLLVPASALEYFQYYAVTSGTNYKWVYSRYNMLKTTYSSPTNTVTHTNGSTDTFNYVVVNSNNESRTNIRKHKGTGSFTFSGNNTSINYLYWLGVQRFDGGYWGSATSSGNWDLK